MRGESSDKKKFSFKKATSHILFIALVAFILLITVFGKNGLLQLIKLNKRVDSYEYKTESLKQDNEQLSEEISLLKNDLGYIEKIARTELGLVKANEIIYIFKDEQPKRN